MSLKQRWIHLFDTNEPEIFENNNSSLDLQLISMLYTCFQKECEKVSRNMRKVMSDLEQKENVKCNCNSKAENQKVLKSRFCQGTSSHSSTDHNFYDKLCSLGTTPVQNSMSDLDIRKSPTLNERKKKVSDPLLKDSTKTPVRNKASPRTSRRVKSLSVKLSQKLSSEIAENVVEETPPPRISNVFTKSFRKINQRKEQLKEVEIFNQSKKSPNSSKQKDDSMELDEMLDELDKFNSNILASNSDSDSSSTSDGILENIIRKNPVETRKATVFLLDYDKVPEPKVDDLTYAHVTKPLRGLARKKLKGWSCKECKEFYEAMNLSPSELEKKMDECSRHKSKFQPIPDTCPGFWDLTIPPTPDHHKIDLDDTADQSTIFFG